MSERRITTQEQILLGGLVAPLIYVAKNRPDFANYILPVRDPATPGSGSRELSKRTKPFFAQS